MRARVGRHLRGGDVRRWHIDYLRAWAHPAAVWIARDSRRECEWAKYLQNEVVARVIVPRFGASDCKCASHLFYFDAHSTEALSSSLDVLPGVTATFTV